MELLTKRELEVFATYLATGKTSSAAHLLGVSLQTIKNHCANVYAKLECSGVLEAAQALGWLNVPKDFSAHESRIDRRLREYVG